MILRTWHGYTMFENADAYVPDAARKILSCFDERSQHYEVMHELEYE